MKYPINTLKEALYELRYPSLNECKKEWENRRRWQSELKQAIELLSKIEL